jgi:transcriptional regulator with XRE-family HTH domain
MNRAKTDIVLTSRIKSIVEEKGLKLKDLAELLGISIEGLSKMINNRYKSIDLKMAAMMANKLEVSINDLFDTGCIIDENNRAVLQLLDSYFDSNETLNQLTDNEKGFLLELFSNINIDVPKRTKSTEFLTKLILDSYYNNKDLTLKYGINLTSLVDKINEFSELENLNLINNFLRRRFK